MSGADIVKVRGNSLMYRLCVWGPGQGYPILGRTAIVPQATHCMSNTLLVQK